MDNSTTYTPEKLANYINNDESLIAIQKNILLGQCEQAFKTAHEHAALRQAIKDCFNKQSIVIEEVTELDDRYVIFRYAADKDNMLYRTYDREQNRLSTEVSDHKHHQVLITLGVHYDGLNQRFSIYAARMLNIL
jgi:predicted ATP-grasp superfamily ATP-dependent carboligase